MAARSAVLAGVLAAAALGPAAAPAAATAVREATLPNGLRVLVEADPRTPVASVQVWYRVGSGDEAPGRSGLSHFLEHLMFKGTARHGPGAYAARVEAVGAEHNAFTTRDATAYHVTVAPGHVDLVLRLEADRMRGLRLDPRAVEAERAVVTEERRTRTEDDPLGALAEAFALTAFAVHPYRLPTVGFMEDIARLSAADLRRWYDAYYRPNNALVVAAGAVDPERLLAGVRAAFGGIPRGPRPPRAAVAEPAPPGPRRVWVRRPARLAVVLVGHPAPPHPSPDAPALEVLATVLAGGRASRLHRRLVHGERLALDAGGDYAYLSLDPGLFTTHATALPGTPVETLEAALLDELGRVREGPVAEDELARARNQVEAGLLFGQDSPHDRAALLARFELAGGWRLRDGYLAAVRAVTAADVQRVARRYLVEDRRTTAVLVPLPDGAGGERPPGSAGR